MIKQLQTTRACSVCGQKKPLVAFLMLAGGEGHTYGDICATCRGSGRTIEKPNEEPGDDSGDNSRLRLDSKAKLQIERDIKEKTLEHTNQDHKEKIKKETSEEEKTSEIEKREKEEKKFREKFQELKRAAKAAAAQPNNPQGQISQAQGFYQEKARAGDEFHNKAAGERLGKKTTGLSVDYINRYVAATGRSAESLFGRLLGQFLKTNIDVHQKTFGPDQKKNGDKAAPPEGQAKNENNSLQENKGALPGGQAKIENNPPQENAAEEFVKNTFKKR